MDKARIEKLTNGGIDVNDALARFMNSDALLERFLKKFCDDKNYSGLVAAAENRDVDGMIRTSHTLKGMSGNLSMKKLFELLNNQLDDLRSGKTDAAIELMPQISEEYNRIVNSVQGD